MLLRGWVKTLGLGIGLALAAPSYADSPKLDVSWTKGALTQLDGDTLKRDKAKSGLVSLVSVAEDVLKPLSATDKSRLDWVILRLQGAPQVWVPWAALKTLKLELRVPDLTLKVRSVADLPYAGVSAMDGKRVTHLEFGNVRDRLGPWFLTQRTDPIALKGEKTFVQGCAACHAQGNGVGLIDVKGKLLTWSAKSFEHPSGKPGAPTLRLTEKETRGLSTYVHALKP